MRKIEPKLVAVVVYKPAPKLGKAKVVTDITIKFDGQVVGTATKAGKYSQDQALTEFRRNPGSFWSDNPGAVALALLVGKAA